MAQSTNCSKLISACLPLLSTNIPRLLSLNLSAEQLKEVLRLPSITEIAGERQLRLVTNWMDTEETNTSETNPVDLLGSLLPLVDLQSISDDTFLNFIRENHPVLRSHQCR